MFCLDPDKVYNLEAKQNVDNPTHFLDLSWKSPNGKGDYIQVSEYCAIIWRDLPIVTRKQNTHALTVHAV